MMEDDRSSVESGAVSRASTPPAGGAAATRRSTATTASAARGGAPMPVQTIRGASLSEPSAAPATSGGIAPPVASSSRGSSPTVVVVSAKPQQPLAQASIVSPNSNASTTATATTSNAPTPLSVSNANRNAVQSGVVGASSSASQQQQQQQQQEHHESATALHLVPLRSSSATNEQQQQQQQQHLNLSSRADSGSRSSSVNNNNNNHNLHSSTGSGGGTVVVSPSLAGSAATTTTTALGLVDHAQLQQAHQQLADAERRIADLEHEKDALNTAHLERLHATNQELATLRRAAIDSEKANAQLQTQVQTAVDSERDSFEENRKLREQLRPFVVRAKTVNGDLATWDDKRHTLMVNNVKGRFDLSVQCLEGFIELLRHEKRLQQQDVLCYQRAHERADQMLAEGDSLRDEMAAAAAAAEEAHARQMDAAHRTIDELQRDLAAVTSGGGGGGGGNSSSSKREPTASTDHLLGLDRATSSRAQTPSPGVGRGASSTHLRSATAPMDPEATSRRLQDELSDALQAKEALGAHNRQLKSRIRELEGEMQALYGESRRVHGLMKDDLRECRDVAHRATADEVERVKQENAQLQTQLLQRIENLESALAERTQTCLHANQQVRHLTEALEDACKAGAVPLLRTAGEGNGYPKFTLGRKKSTPASPSYMWTSSTGFTNSGGASEDGGGSPAHPPSGSASPSTATTPYMAAMEQQRASPHQHQLQPRASSANAGGYVAHASASKSSSAAASSSFEQPTTPVRPSWNHSKRTAMPFPTASQHQTQQPRGSTSTPCAKVQQQQRYDDPSQQQQYQMHHQHQDEEQQHQHQQQNAGGYTAGMLPPALFPQSQSADEFNDSRGVSGGFGSEVGGAGGLRPGWR